MQVTSADVHFHVETPRDGLGEHVTVAVGVLRHPPSGRSVRREVVVDNEAESVRDTQRYLINGSEVHRRTYDTVEWGEGGVIVFQDGHLELEMTPQKYAAVVGADEAEWKLGVGFVGRAP